MLTSRRPLLVAVIAAVTASALMVGVSGAGADKGGNSENAKLCQKGGWEDLVGSRGQSFESEEECVSHAAEGGTLLTPQQYLQSQFQAICEDADPLTTFFVDDTGAWWCRAPAPRLSQELYNTLTALCIEAGGMPMGIPFPTTPPYGAILCTFP